MAAPQPPSYTDYIKTMTDIGQKGTDRSQALYDEAVKYGDELKGTARTAGDRAGALADATAGTDPRLEALWEQTYLPLYKAQAADATRMLGELPNTEEQYAGKYAATAEDALNASKAGQNRVLQSYGLKRPGIASAALDAQAGAQRGLAKAAGSETGRLAARNEARTVAGQAITQGKDIPQVGGQQAQIALQSGAQQVALPAQAGTTAAAIHSPGLGYYQAAYPWMAQWGSTMANAYNQSLAAYNAGEASGGGLGAIAGSLLGAAGSIGGAYAGSAKGSEAIGGIFGAEHGGVIRPVAPSMEDGGVVPEFKKGGIAHDLLGTAGSALGMLIPVIGPMIGKFIGHTLGNVIEGNTGEIGDDAQRDATFGMLDPDSEGGFNPGGILGAGGAGYSGGSAMGIFAAGGEVTPPGNGGGDNYVEPSMSGSNGAITDDVPARLNAGEFVLPKDVVGWLGEEKLHKLIMSTREKMGKTKAESGAEPELGDVSSEGAINMAAPTFMSEGAMG